MLQVTQRVVVDMEEEDEDLLIEPDELVLVIDPHSAPHFLSKFWGTWVKVITKNGVGYVPEEFLRYPDDP